MNTYALQGQTWQWQNLKLIETYLYEACSEAYGNGIAKRLYNLLFVLKYKNKN